MTREELNAYLKDVREYLDETAKSSQVVLGLTTGGIALILAVMKGGGQLPSRAGMIALWLFVGSIVTWMGLSTALVGARFGTSAFMPVAFPGGTEKWARFLAFSQSYILIMGLLQRLLFAAGVVSSVRAVLK
jgi:hypothetical protein